jgi:predicted dehydrogenase
MKTQLSRSRRHFLRSAAAAGAGLLLTPLAMHAARSKPASERITVGMIGIGAMGRPHLDRLLGFEDVQVVAVCDVEKTRRETARAQVEKRYAARQKDGVFKGCDAYTDFRALIARKDIDAVVVATPDHLHVIIALAAARAGKDIYCEKPLTQNIHEGRLLVDAVKKHRIIFQTGSQQRSEFNDRFRKAVEFIWNGRIGRLKTIHVGVGAPPVACDLPEQPTPTDVDWELWLGPAPLRGYNEILCPKGMHRHYPLFRNYREFAGGALADMGAHHFDIAQWAMGMDASGPTLITPPAGDAVTGLKFTYANGVELFHGGKSGCTFEGTDGTLYVDRGVLESSRPEILSAPLSATDRRVYPSNQHMRNWLDCVRERRQAICPAEVGHRTASVCHLANIGYQLRRPLQWDPVKEQFGKDPEANQLVSRRPRAPWSYSMS